MSRINRTLLATLCIAWIAGQAQGYRFVPKNIDEAKGPKVYHLGNSHTDSIREELAGLAVRAGHTGYAFGTHTIPGAPLRWLKGHPADSFEQLRQHAWDVVVLQSYNSTNEEEIQAAIDYARAAREGNEKVHVIMYSIWPNEENWDNPTLGRREEWNEGVAARIAKAIPGIKVHVAPTSLVIRRVGNAADEGLIPGLTTRRDLYSDAGHMGSYGAYAICCTMAAMIFQESPLGYPCEVLKAGGGYVRTDEVAFDVGKDTAAAIQRIVWDTLAEYKHDGVDTGMVINAGRLPPGVAGLAYDQPLPVVNAPGGVSWEIVRGDLPAGLTLAKGRIAGTPTETGTVELTLRATSRDPKAKDPETATRAVALTIAPDDPLAIPVQKRLTLKPKRDEYVHHQLKADGAVGRVTWSVAEGKLPPGLLLTDGGMLMGTPGAEGLFAATLQAADRHPKGPRTATRTLAFVVGPPSEGAIRARKVTDEVRRDGKLDEGFWSLDRVLRDAKGNEVGRFDVVWYEDPTDRRAYRTRKLVLAVTLAPDAASAIPNESVHLYIDTRHNRETIYNEDDLHYVFRRNDGPRAPRPFGGELVQGYKATRHFREGVRVAEDGGWTVEMEIRRGVFAGRGVHTTFGPDVTYGFDLAIGSADDPAKRVYFRGGPKADKDTTAFGSLVIAGQ